MERAQSLMVAAGLLLAGVPFRLALAADSKPVAAAREHLKAGRCERVLDELAPAENLPAKVAGELMGAAAACALRAGDAAMAGLYCEKALRLDPGEPQALRACATVAAGEGRFDDAAPWAERLGALAPKDGEVALLRARCAAARADWAAVVALLEPHEAAPDLAVAPLLGEARGKLSEPAPAEPDGRALERRVESALRQVREAERADRLVEERGPGSPKHRPVGESVVLYTARNCSRCDEGRGWLEDQGIEFVEKAVDRGHLSRSEAQRLCVKARILGECQVPIFVVNGEAVFGFDAPKLQELLGL